VGLGELARRHEEKLRFLVVGVWNVAFSLAVLWLLDRFIPYDHDSVWQKEAIFVLNWAIAVTQNFFTFKLLVFRTKGHWLSEYGRMYVTYTGTLIVQSVLMQVTSAVFHLGVFWATVPTIFIVTIMSYLGHKYFTFGRGRHAVEVIDAGDVFEGEEADGGIRPGRDD
jgi:putative flippase GtrA